MKILNPIVFYLLLITMISCKEKSSKEPIVNKNILVNTKDTDSTELTNLIRQVYKWHNTNELEDFPYKYIVDNDSIFHGIDWEKYQENIDNYKKENFFSNDFLKRHREIAHTIDTSIKKADLKWRNSNDGISIWQTGADDWCGCQDYPDNYWDVLTIDSLIVKGNKASFIWTWDKEFSHTYKVSAKKVSGKWKINTLEGFKHFYKMEDY